MPGSLRELARLSGLTRFPFTPGEIKPFVHFAWLLSPVPPRKHRRTPAGSSLPRTCAGSRAEQGAVPTPAPGPFDTRHPAPCPGQHREPWPGWTFPAWLHDREPHGEPVPIQPALTHPNSACTTRLRDRHLANHEKNALKGHSPSPPFILPKYINYK